jgi:hypothetical protein
VDDIITSHLDAKQLVVHAQDGRVSIQYWLSETEREDGITDLFNVSTPLNVILSELRDRLSDENDAELADNTAALLESIAAECRAEAATIRQQQ